jgi:catechol 2,3-dioxygenase-like lactoylglutathione lyase family enzyme
VITDSFTTLKSEDHKMLTHVTGVSVWVRDLDEALAFYTEKLGFEVREDVTLPELGNYRWLTVGPTGQPELAFALNVPGPPFDGAVTDGIKELMAKGVLTGLFFTVDDCRAAAESLKGRGVTLDQEPTQVPYGIEAVLHDPSGNSIRVVQRS